MNTLRAFGWLALAIAMIVGGVLLAAASIVTLWQFSPWGCVAVTAATFWYVNRERKKEA